MLGTAPPQKPTSTKHSPCALPRLSASAARSTVAGIELSGMSRIVVTPPAAAAAVAVAKPSHSVRPGSLTCTWVSTMPGISTSSAAKVAVLRARQVQLSASAIDLDDAAADADRRGPERAVDEHLAHR